MEKNEFLIDIKIIQQAKYYRITVTLNPLTAAHREVSWLLLSQEGNRKSRAALILFFSVINGSLKWKPTEASQPVRGDFCCSSSVGKNPDSHQHHQQLDKHKLIVLSLLFSLVIL